MDYDEELQQTFPIFVNKRNMILLAMQMILMSAILVKEKLYNNIFNDNDILN